jgi:hypothetical protein
MEAEVVQLARPEGILPPAFLGYHAAGMVQHCNNLGESYAFGYVWKWGILQYLKL